MHFIVFLWGEHHDIIKQSIVKSRFHIITDIVMLVYLFNVTVGTMRDLHDGIILPQLSVCSMFYLSYSNFYYFWDK